MLTITEKNNSFLIHLSAFCGFIFPLGSVIVPLILWSVQKDKSEFINKNGKESVNFNISYFLYIFVLGISLIPLTLESIVGFLNHTQSWNDFPHFFGLGNLFGVLGIVSVIFLLGIIKIILIIIAAIKANKGEIYHYPLTIQFIK